MQTQTLKVPLVGTNVIPEGEGPAVDGAPYPGSPQPAPIPAAPQQPPAKASLHRIRMARPEMPQPEFKGQLDERTGRVKWTLVEQTAEPEADGAADVEVPAVDAGGDAQTGGFDVPPHPDSQQVPPPTAQTFSALEQQIQALTNTVNLLAQTQLRGGQQPQQPQAPQPPDPTQYDFYEPQQVAEFHRLNNIYLQDTVQRSVQAALEPHRAGMQDAELSRQYNAVLANHGNNPNFKPLMNAALELVQKSGGQYSIPDAYDRAELEAHRNSQTSSPRQPAATTSQPVAKPAQRTLTAQEAAQKAAQAQSLPPRNGVSGAGAEPGLPSYLNNVGALGRIWLHNQQTGRARPI